MSTNREVAKLGDEELLERVRALVVRCNETEAELIAFLAEVDARRLYLPRRTSLWDFCLYELGFSENTAWNRITVARASRRHPQVLEALARGRVHLTGLKMLCPELTAANADALLAEAAGKTKREIEELLVARRPKPPVADSIRKLPSAAPELLPTPVAASPIPQAESAAPLVLSAAPAATRPPRADVAPVAPEQYLIKLTASKSLHDQLRRAQDLTRHENPSGDLARILEEALSLYVEKKLKEKFSIGRRARAMKAREGSATSRHVPAAIQRAVYARDEGRCTFIDPDGRRCDSTAFISFDHVDGFARTREHDAERIRLLCRAHNQHAADVMYGKTWMDMRRQSRD